MPNPIKGAVNIEISGKSYPLIFNYDAIAQIENQYDMCMLDAAIDMTRIEKIYAFLVAGLGGKFTLEELKAEQIPPITDAVELVGQAFNLAYFGGEIIEDEAPEKAKKKRWFCLWLA